jgi:hypothetical protein
MQRTKDDLKLSKDEEDRLTKAFKEPEFKKLMGKKLPNCDCEVKEDAQNDPEWKKIQGFPTFKMHKSNGEVEVYGEDKSKCLNGQCKRDALSLEHFVSECGKA